MKSLTSLTPNLDLKESGDNPVQAVLRAALARLGPNGENLDPNAWPSPMRGRMCAVTAMKLEHGGVCGTLRWTDHCEFLKRAAREQGSPSIEGIAYLGWEPTQRMFLRAISLSA